MEVFLTVTDLNEKLIHLFLYCVLQRLFRIFYNLSVRVGKKLETTIPGFDKIMEKVQKDYDARLAQRMKRREEQLKARDLKYYSGRTDEDEEEDDDKDSSDTKSLK